ncbi:MAG: tyrosine-type recombinase/integrase [Flavobacteriaceae bacterium]|nr:MAG: tyrosine-type recombinase/integrase [Flavobacteriaceae bacterium]
MKIPLILPLFKRFALHEKGMKQKTIKEIIAIVSALSKELSNPSVTTLTTSKIREFLYQRKLERMWTNKTFRNYRQYLKTFFDYCLRENYIDMNPVEKIEKPKLPKRIPRCLDKNQVENLLLHLDCYSWFNDLEAKRNKAIIRTFLFTGVRLNELLKLQTTSVNFEESEIIIYQGKGNKDRVIPIHPDLMPYLKTYHQSKKKPTLYFFSSIRSDKPLTENNLYSIIKKIRCKTKFHFTPHQLRHTFGKFSIEGNLNPFKLQKIMGHSSIETTQIYVYVSDNNLKESFQKTVLL